MECVRRADKIKFPVYLSTGQEYIPAVVADVFSDIPARQVFIQHRGHSTYLCFGGDMGALVLELLGRYSGCAQGMGGSASIHSKEANIYGHDGLLGSNVPIAVGACFANRVPTICFLGDAAIEEDYALSALGWAATKQLPILFVVEDNNLSILTEKSVRRSWRVVDVAAAFGIRSYDVPDDPEDLWRALPKTPRTLRELRVPWLVNVHTTRMRWHAGVGVDDQNAFDRHRAVGTKLYSEWQIGQIEQEYEKQVRETWERHLGT